MIGAVLLIPAVTAFLVDIMNAEGGRSGAVRERVEAYGAKTLPYVFCALTAVVILAPVAAFCMMTFARKYPADMSFTLYHAAKSVRRGALSYLVNSVIYAVLAGTLGTLLAFACSYITARLERRFSKVLHLLSLLTMAVPGIVLGLSYVIFFSGSPIYGTVFIIIIVNLVHFFASPYIMMFNAFKKINPAIEDTGAALGVPRIHIIIDVILPEVMPVICEMFAYFFVNSMMTVSAVSFLAPPSPRPVALMIPQFEAQLLMESAAFVSLMILAVNAGLKILFARKIR